VEEIGKNSSIQYFLGFEEFETDREIDNKSLLVQSLYKIESSLKEYSDNKKMVRRNIMNRKSDLFKNNKQLIFRNSGGYLFINPEDVIYLNANGNYTSFILENEQPRRVNSIMGQIELRLNPNKFIRINRSYIINLDYISEINLSKRQCKLHSKNGKEFYCPISRGKITKISRKIKELKTFIS
jgi:two-component system LytT family response regulator